MRTKPDHGEETYRGSGRLSDKTVLITGGDRGIGKAVALACAREGADVAISYLREEETRLTRRTLFAGSKTPAAGVWRRPEIFATNPTAVT